MLSVSQGADMNAKEKEILAEMEEIYIWTVEVMKRVCVCPNTLNSSLHKGAYNYTYTHFSKADLRMKTI